MEAQNGAHPPLVGQVKHSQAGEGVASLPLLDELPVAAYTCDAAGLLTYFNQRAAELWGRKPLLLEAAQRFCGSLRLFAPDGTPVAHEQSWAAQTLRAGSPCGAQELVIERPDGGRVTVLGHAGLLFNGAGTPAGVVVTLADISSQKREENILTALVELQQELATAALDLPSVMTLIAERTQQLTGASGAVVELVEGDMMVYRAGSGTAAAHVGLRLPSEGSFSGLCVRQGQALRCDDSELDERVNRAACRAVGLRSMVVVPLIHDGGVSGVLKVLAPKPGAFADRDVRALQAIAGLLAAALSRALAFAAERALVEERTAALRASEERYRRIVEATPNGIWVIDAQARTTFVNPPVARMLGYTEAELLGRTMFAFMDDDMAAEARAVLTHHSADKVEKLDFRFRHKDGAEVWVLVSSVPLMEDGEYVGALAVVIDVTERRKLEERTRQAHKMEVVGQLAGGIAHDFNNMLAVINGYSQLALTRLPAGGEAAEMLQEIFRAGERASSLTRQLLTFSRQQVLAPRILDLNEVIRETEKMLGRLIGENVALCSTLAPGLGKVKADAGQIEQILLNLVVNARDAISTHGRITLETATVELDEEYAKMHPEATPGPYVMLAVSDNGCGMSDEIKQHIFEPFFTTKERGQGTGLGLATVFGIVRQAGGHLDVYSELGYGTVFKIYLPQIEAETTSSEKRFDNRPEAWRGQETILVVEDDPAVRKYICRALDGMGYTILEAAGGLEAITVCRQHSGPIHLLASDVVLPDLGGRELAERLTALRPDLRVLFHSGYTPDAIIRHGVLEAQVAFLQKPFTVDALGRKIREVLDR